MSFSAEVEVAVSIDQLSILQQKYRGSYRLAFSLYRKKGQHAIMDKIKPKIDLAQPFKTAVATELEEEDHSIYTEDESSTDIGIYKARPYVLTDSWHPDCSQRSTPQRLKVGRNAYFRVNLPWFPISWKDPLCLQVDFLFKPDVSMVDQC